MVAVKPRDADRFLADPPDDVRMFLFHGADAGAVTERGRAVVNIAVSRGSDDGNLVRLGSDELAHDPGRLADEALSVSMFVGDTVIVVRISDGRHNLMPALQPLLDAPPEAAWIVVEAGELRRQRRAHAPSPSRSRTYSSTQSATTLWK